MTSKGVFCLFVVSFMVFGLVQPLGIDHEWKTSKLEKLEELGTLGSNLPLVGVEKDMNAIFMNLKKKEVEEAVKKPSKFPPFMHFFKAKKLIEKRKLFKLMKHFPKAANLHIHDIGMVKPEWLFNITYSPNLYICFTEKGKIHFKYFDREDKNKKDKNNLNCDWTLLEWLRKKDPSIDKMIKKQLSLVIEDYDKEYKDQDYLYSLAQELAYRVYELVTYRPMFKKFVKQGLKELYEDNIFYVEIKTFLPNLYDLDGTIYGPLECAQVYKEAIEEFTNEVNAKLTSNKKEINKEEKTENNEEKNVTRTINKHEGLNLNLNFNKNGSLNQLQDDIHNHFNKFLGARIIYAPIRDVDISVAEKYASLVIQLKKKFGDFIAGFDLIGYEDKGKPLSFFSEQIERMKKHGVKFFFHAGETNHFGTDSDEDLFDAILFGSERLGSPNAIIKHPEIMRLVKIKKIALEMLPISNHVQQVVPDIQSNPVSHLIAAGYPVVIGSDVPGWWDASGVSYDYYVVFTTLTDKNADTKVLKQIALNSIEHSAMSVKEKAIAYAQWTVQFTEFSQKIVDINDKV